MDIKKPGMNGIYRYVDEFNPTEDIDSGYSSGKKFRHLNDMMKFVEEHKIKKEKLYINSMHHRVRRDNMTAIEMVQHILRIEKSDLECPVLINWNGDLVDGFHRVTKAILEKKKYIRAYRINLGCIDPTRIDDTEE